MAKGQCQATILQGGLPTKQIVTDEDGQPVEKTILVGATVHRCNKSLGHEKAKKSDFDNPRDHQLTIIHDSSGVTWYDGDLDQFDSPEE